jgi:hypothetical protein
MNKEQIQNKAKALVQSLSDKQVIDGFIDIISRDKNSDNNVVRIWLIEEIESRFPDVQQAIYDFYASEVEDGLTYDERLVKIVKELVNA